MANRTAFRLFLVCLLVCAAMVLGGIWFGKEGVLPPAYFKTTVTFFVVGLASFLIWFSTTLLAIWKLLQSR